MATYIGVAGFCEEETQKKSKITIKEELKQIKTILQICKEESKKKNKTIVVKIKIQYGSVEYWNKNEF